MKTDRVKPKLVLESLMGDPVLSHWIGPEGIAAGTALGRISTYLFQQKPVSKIESARSYKSKSDYSVKKEVNHVVIPVEVEYNPRDVESNPVESPSISSKNDTNETNNCNINEENELDSGRYSVFATYSDEPVYSVFINENALVCLIGTSYLMIYDTVNYKVLSQCSLHLTSSTIKGFKQVIQDGKLVLVSSIKGIVLINLTNGEIHLLNNKSIINNNILSFQFPYISTTSFNYEEKHEKLIGVYKIHLKGANLYNRDTHFNTIYDDNGLEMINELILKEKRIHLITLCKLWSSYIVVVCDLLTILLYNREDNCLHKRKTVKYDILSINSEFEDYFIMLDKNSSLNLVNSNLDILHTFNLYPSTFEIGWSYNVVSYKNLISFNSDEGIYYMKLPENLTHT
ncbi:hypothetical protein MACJ_002275 [Theileria orientalis]|uniref:Uncharacterized protein n=1 Tax=Theileria orientalis TaxID=68886 RepID=A0A976M5Y8_THEOR|nr:hypothetical protein MACJ_002275 [Theileria orientalis]